ncbi:MAG: hypothetical protein ACO3O0_01690 [Bacteroidia bacterium]
MRYFIKLAIMAASCVLFQMKNTSAQSAEDNCILKVNAEWSVPVGSCMDANNSYKAYFVNTCTKTVDIKLAIQEKSMRWKTFNHLSIAPGDTVAGYACNGTGKYVTWFRPSGNKTITFPTDDEINRDYK